MKFTQKTDYALRVMRHLVQLSAGSVVPVHRIAEAELLSPRFLHGVVRELVVRGILRSTPGPTGGIAFGKDPSEVTFRDVVDAVEGPVFLMSCLGDENHCVGATRDCRIQLVLQQSQEAMYKVLAEHNMVELLDTFRPALLNRSVG